MHATRGGLEKAWNPNSGWWHEGDARRLTFQRCRPHAVDLRRRRGIRPGSTPQPSRICVPSVAKEYSSATPIALIKRLTRPSAFRCARQRAVHGCPGRQRLYRSSIMDAEPPRASSRSQIVSARRSFAWTGLLQSSPANPSATTQHLCVAASVTTNAWRHSGDGSSALVSPGLKSAHDAEAQPSASSSFSARLRTTTRLGSRPLAAALGAGARCFNAFFKHASLPRVGGRSPDGLDCNSATSPCGHGAHIDPLGLVQRPSSALLC